MSMKRLSIKKPGQRRKLRGNATGLNMMGVGKVPRNGAMAWSRTEVLAMVTRKPAERAVVLSSGDEGIYDGAGTHSVNGQDCNTLSPGATVVANLSSPSPPNSSEEPLDDHDDILSISNSFTYSKARRPRKNCMKDQLGNSPVKVVSPLSKRSAKRQKPKRRDPSSSPQPNEMPESVSKAVRLSRVGTRCRQVTRPVQFTANYIQIDEEVCLGASTLTSCHWCLDRRLPSLFLRTTPAECHRLRLLLKMSRMCRHGASWYDSKGANVGERYIILVFEDLLEEEEVALKRIFETIARANHVDDFTGELTFNEANGILMEACKKEASDQDIFQSQYFIASFTEPVTSVCERVHHRNTPEPPAVTYGPESPRKVPKATAWLLPQQSSLQLLSPTYITDDEDSAVDLTSTFNEPVRRLIVYPPPPARHGISVTNEDLHCLDKGEFLNDVIIEFYLRYLVVAKLKEEDAERSHVFSTFFYKNLTQKEQDKTSGGKKQRHSRVKTWTRHVDLFQKDFIFVPINLSAHWFLAVICFPGLEGSQWKPASPSSSSPQDPSPDAASGLTHHQPVGGSSTDPPLRHDPNHLRHTDQNPPWHGLSVWEESEDAMDQSFARQDQEFTPGPNPMSLFFTAVEDDPFSSPGADLREEEDRAMSTGDESDDLWPRIKEFCETGQTGGQRPHADVFHKDCEEARCVDMLSFDEDADDESNGEERADKRDLADISSKPAVRKRPSILIMDSLGGRGGSHIVQTLQEYLEVEWELKKGTRREFRHMEGCVPQVPQQDNHSDCGVYLLQYVESFFKDPLKSFRPPIDLNEWFPLKHVKSKRAEIRELILTLQQQGTRT